MNKEVPPRVSLGARDQESVEDASVVVLIDDNPTEADQYKRLLEASGLHGIEVERVRSTLDGYADLVRARAVGAVIVDQQLSEYAGVSHLGMDVANYLRAINSALPVFILTNYYSDDLDAEGTSVDFIMDKSGVRNRGASYVARILRRMGQYRTTLSARDARLQYLIDQKLEGGLSEAEADELQSIRRDVERPSAIGLDRTMEQVDRRRREDDESQSKRLAELHALVDRIELRLPTPVDPEEKRGARQGKRGA